MKDQTDDKERGINIVVANKSQTSNNNASGEICPDCGAVIIEMANHNYLCDCGPEW
jgi:ribosomal protein S27AE